MISTELYEGQGLGNQLWNYAAARSIAEHLEVPFCLFGFDRFKAKSFLTINFQDPGTIPEKVSHTFHERVFYDKELDYISSGFDERVRALQSNTLLKGLYQSEKYFFGDLDKLKSYVLLNEEYKNLYKFPEDLCILNIRGGEYKRHKRFILPKEYWINGMEQMKQMGFASRFLIVTDDPKYARALFPRIEVLDGGVAECYAALYSARNVIVSNSTFSYFPIKTSPVVKAVIGPKLWARFGNIYSRWASPANIYEDWNYLDEKGTLHSYPECVSLSENTERYYYDNYSLLTEQNAVMKLGLRRLIPGGVKKILKKGLSVLLPTRFG